MMLKHTSMAFVLLVVAAILCNGVDDIITAWILGLMGWAMLTYYNNKDYGDN